MRTEHVNTIANLAAAYPLATYALAGLAGLYFVNRAIHIFAPSRFF